MHRSPKTRQKKTLLDHSLPVYLLYTQNIQPRAIRIIQSLLPTRILDGNGFVVRSFVGWIEQSHHQDVTFCAVLGLRTMLVTVIDVRSPCKLRRTVPLRGKRTEENGYVYSRQRCCVIRSNLKDLWPDLAHGDATVCFRGVCLGSRSKQAPRSFDSVQVRMCVSGTTSPRLKP